MLVITVEVWPCGDYTQSRIIGRTKIVNDETGDNAIANYDVLLTSVGVPIAFSGQVRKHPRHLSPWQLVLKALKATVPTIPE